MIKNITLQIKTMFSKLVMKIYYMHLLKLTQYQSEVTII